VGYQLKPHSARAANIFVPDVDLSKPMPIRSLGAAYPFHAMQPGQSFFLRFDETSQYIRTLAKETLKRYNRSYRMYFVAIKHEDEPKRLEIARIV
jgi:rhamnose utilization protein RhaD (predicted bifunctional aldolase and dehydrogenase)